MARIVNFVDGAESETTPTIGNITASDLVEYVDDAAYEAAESGAPAAGNIYYNTTLNQIRYYNGTSWITLADVSTAQTFTNKSIDADANTVTNIDNDNIKVAAAIDATKIHDGSVDNTEFGYLNGVTSGIQSQIDGKIDSSEKGAANGVATLDGAGTVPASQLPSYVDDVVEYADLASFPVTGETGKIYIALDTNYQYRWTGSVYVDITSKVDSVNGQAGAVSLGLVDLDDVNITLGAGEDTKVVSYDHASGDFILVEQTGGTGEGGINYIENSGFEDGTQIGWTLYNDGASATPVDGTGGSLSALTSSVQNSTDLRGTKFLRLSKSGVNGQGDGASYDFSIDSADKNKVLRVAFDYKTTSFTTGDVRVFVYDIDNTTLIGAIDNDDSGNVVTSTSPDLFSGTFTATTSSNYRLIFHVATTTVGAWDLDIDRVQVGPFENSEVLTLVDAFRTTTLTSNASNRVQITGMSENIDLKSEMSGSTFTAAASGYYLLEVYFESDTFDALVDIEYDVNNSGSYVRLARASGVGAEGNSDGRSGQLPVFLNAGDVVRFYLWGNALVRDMDLFRLKITRIPTTAGVGVSEAPTFTTTLLQDSVTTFTTYTGGINSWVAIAQVDLTDGEWDLEARVAWFSNGGTTTTELGIAITDNTGTGNPGNHAIDKIFTEMNQTNGDFTDSHFSKRGVVVSGGPTTWYLRTYVGTSNTNVQYACLLTARKVSS